MQIRINKTISRRRFFSLSGGALAAAAFSQQARGTGGFPVGIQLYMVSADLTKDPAGTLKKIAQIGYSEVETVGWGTPPAAQLHDLLLDAGLRAPSAHLLFGMQDTSKLLDDAKTLGVEYAVSSVLSPNEFPKDPKAMQDFLAGLSTMSADDFRRTAAKDEGRRYAVRLP
jgi:hypothetical protein